MKNVVIDRRMIQAVIQGSSPERTRYAFDGIQVENGETRQLVATDGTWLIRGRFPQVDVDTVRAGSIPPVKEGNPEENKGLVPFGFLQDLTRSCRGRLSRLQDLKTVFDTDGPDVSARYLPASTADAATFTGRLVEGSFPNFAPLFEKDYSGPSWKMATKILEGVVKAAKAVKAEHIGFQFPPKSKSTMNEKGGYAHAVRFVLMETEDADQVGQIDGLVMPIVD